ncbi:MAG: hypothetical protein Q9174_000214 [Haloplaca sp. 1 TL-2023]
MAAVRSLGVHRPSALPFLVTEGIVASESVGDSLTWQQIHSDVEDGRVVEEELITTEYCAVWSRAGVIQRVFRFDSEKEKISKAVFAKFPFHLDSVSPKRVDLGHEGRDRNRGGPSLEVSAPTEGYTSDGATQIRMHATGTQRDKGRALVVFLKTQAHVFFLQGTSHIVHLPFEVENAFPLPEGILLQRKAPCWEETRESSPRLKRQPPAPPNSFAFSQQSSDAQYGFEEQPAALPLRQRDEENTPFSTLVRKVVQKAAASTVNTLPRLFSLTDPLSQLGTVGLKRTKSETQFVQHSLCIGEGSSSDAEFLYVSSQDEKRSRSQSPSLSTPFILAVTLDRHANTFTIWHVAAASHLGSKIRNGREASTTKHVPPRRRSRRSSLGAAAATGTGSPVPRGGDARDSFGPGQPRQHGTNDRAQQKQDISAQLDTALESSTSFLKSSRRVSSLLARADLSTSQDSAVFSELAGGHRTSQHARHGPSAGADALHSNFPSNPRISLSKARSGRSFEASIESQSQHREDFDESFADVDGIDDLSAFNALDIGEGARSLRQDYGMTEISTTSLAAQHPQGTVTGNLNEKFAVYTFRPPSLSLRDHDKDDTVYLYFVDKRTRVLFSLRVEVKGTQSGPVDDRDVDTRPSQPRAITIARLEGVIDACKVQDGVCSRLLVLSESLDGKGSLSLQAPWSAIHQVSLPESLNLYNPTQITTSGSSHEKREGGFKRVINRGAQVLSGLLPGDGQGQVDALDSEKVRHRVHVQLRPHDPLVNRMINTCEAVMPLLGGRREVTLCAWWAVVRWLRLRSEVKDDLEWTALVIVLFLWPASNIEKWHSKMAPRQERRKGGLLRSSSGANTDLGSWEAMLAQEAGHLSPSPPWMQDSAWTWVTEQASAVTPQEARRTPSRQIRPLPSSHIVTLPRPQKSAYLLRCCAVAREIIQSTTDDSSRHNTEAILSIMVHQNPASRGTITATLLASLHLLREEMKLDSTAAQAFHSMTPVLAQLGSWLGWKSWGFKSPSSYACENIDMESWLFDDSVMARAGMPADQPLEPPSIFGHIEELYCNSAVQPFMSLVDVVDPRNGPTRSSMTSPALRTILLKLTPRTAAIGRLLSRKWGTEPDSSDNLFLSQINLPILETFPEGIAASLRSIMSGLHISPDSIWYGKGTTMRGNEDPCGPNYDHLRSKTSSYIPASTAHHVSRDVHTICTVATGEVESVGAYDGSAEADRHGLTRLIFKDDQRFTEATKLLNPVAAPMVRCTPEPTWSDTELLEAQQELVKLVAMRTLSVSMGRSLLTYCARFPLITEKFPIHGFTLSCVMKPNNTTVTADRGTYTEEKVSWAFFHAGVEAGLSISKDARGIDTSWILFNKPSDLRNRHAGFLLALGLNGHMREISKIMSYTYLTAKHPMTSIGFLLGVSASHLGTMDVDVTRLLSIHVTRLLPPGSAELNVSPLTQTSSIMGIGLVYCNTQHRMMSDMMLTEMENMDYEEGSNPQDNLRDEGYRLAAGFALGYINLGRGKDLRGLHDMHIVERLLKLATEPKKAELVHLLDKATAAATVAIALIFMKTGNQALARRIDVPETIHQFDNVRPDVLLLRTVARHLIMWDDISPSAEWMQKQLPSAFRNRRPMDSRSVTSHELPYMNILAGLCLSLGLRYAGTGELEVRNLLCHQLDQFVWMCRLTSPTYDRRLTRITARNCQDTVALAAACVMAGTGDILVFRRLRALHGRTDAETPYGSHLAAHLAIGVLFLGGGTHSFGTSDVAVASLLCAFYPLFPTSVLDNKSHLQAFRHLWALAAEPRCLVVRDVDTHNSLPIQVTFKLRKSLASFSVTAPCLLPESESIAAIVTGDQSYWPVALDFVANPQQLSAFKRHQTIYVRRRPPGCTDGSVFSATMLTLNNTQAADQFGQQMFNWIFHLTVFANFDRSEKAQILSHDLTNITPQTFCANAVDDSLVLKTACMQSGRSERLWNLRLLFAWADAQTARSGRWAWLGEDTVMRLRANLYLKLGAEREK